MALEDDPALSELLADCEDAIGYQFRDRGLLEQCLTHASISTTRLGSNERLEFLGDAVLGLVVSRLLYDQFPKSPEGELTRMKSALVSRAACRRVAEEHGLEECLLIGKGLLRQYQLPDSILAAVVESLIAGVYLDGGFDAARGVIGHLFESEVARIVASGPVVNYKSRLQQFCQRTIAETPSYRLLDEKGPDHAKCFQVAAELGSRMFDPAWGPSKKDAEQQAARNALEQLLAECDADRLEEADPDEFNF